MPRRLLELEGKDMKIMSIHIPCWCICSSVDRYLVSCRLSKEDSRRVPVAIQTAFGGYTRVPLLFAPAFGSHLNFPDLETRPVASDDCKVKVTSLCEMIIGFSNSISVDRKYRYAGSYFKSKNPGFLFSSFSWSPFMYPRDIFLTEFSDVHGGICTEEQTLHLILGCIAV